MPIVHIATLNVREMFSVPEMMMMIIIVVVVVSPWSLAAFSLWCRVQSMNLGQS